MQIYHLKHSPNFVVAYRHVAKVVSIIFKWRDMQHVQKVQWWASQKQPRHYSKVLPSSTTLVISTAQHCKTTLHTANSDSTGVVLKRSLIKHPDWHKLPSYSCSSTAVVLEWTRSPFRLNQNQTLKVCSMQPWWYHPVPHKQKGSVTYSTSAEGWLTTGQGWQCSRERKIFWNCFLEEKGESFNRV